MRMPLKNKLKVLHFIKYVFIFVKEGEIWSYHVLRVVQGWELWVGVHIVMNGPISDETC